MKKLMIVLLMFFAIASLHAEIIYSWKCFRCGTRFKMSKSRLIWAISEGRICKKCDEQYNVRTTVHESFARSKKRVKIK